MATRQGREFWSRAVAAAEAGSASHAQVAARFGVRLTTLRAWIYRLRRERREGGTKARVRMLPVRVNPATTAASVTVRVGGVALEFAAGSDPAYVAAVASAVRASC